MAERKCATYNSNGKKCSLPPSTEEDDDPRYCWKHQPYMPSQTTSQREIPIVPHSQKSVQPISPTMDFSEVFDTMDPHVIQMVCQKLVDQKEFRTLLYLTQSRKVFHLQCQSILSAQKRAHFKHYPTASEFLNDKELVAYRKDLRMGSYERWIKSYPQYVTTIFAGLLTESGDGSLRGHDFERMQNLGVDFNLSSNVYLDSMKAHSKYDSMAPTPLVAMCYQRKEKYLSSLIIFGADVNLHDIQFILPYEALFIGTLKEHGLFSNPLYMNLDDLRPNTGQYVEEIEACLMHLMYAGLIKQMDRAILKGIMSNFWIFERYSTYVEQSLKETTKLSFD